MSSSFCTPATLGGGKGKIERGRHTHTRRIADGQTGEATWQ